MRIGKNNCQWLTSGSTERCSKRCMGEYCGVHLNRLRKGGGTKPCIQCGKGVYNRFPLCQGCANEKANDWLLIKAAEKGYPECMQLAKDWGATAYDLALVIAAGEGHPECMQLAKDWGATDYDWALIKAAEKGHPECMQLAKDWGATDYGEAFIAASGGGHPECMQLAKDWGTPRGAAAAA